MLLSSLCSSSPWFSCLLLISFRTWMLISVLKSSNFRSLSYSFFKNSTLGISWLETSDISDSRSASMFSSSFQNFLYFTCFWVLLFGFSSYVNIFWVSWLWCEYWMTLSNSSSSVNCMKFLFKKSFGIN